MSFLMRQVAHCDICGHEWITSKVPSHCAKCKSRKWNQGQGVPLEQARRFDTNVSPFNAVISPTQFESCKKEGHRGFQRSDGYWCITCSKMFKHHSNPEPKFSS